MVVVTGQNVPAEYISAYISNLQYSTAITAGAIYGDAIYGVAIYGSSGTKYVRERYPFRLPHMQGGLT